MAKTDLGRMIGEKKEAHRGENWHRKTSRSEESIPIGLSHGSFARNHVEQKPNCEDYQISSKGTIICDCVFLSVY